MGNVQGGEGPCISFDARLTDQASGAPDNKNISRSYGTKELLGAYRAHTIAVENTNTLVGAVAEQASERLDRIEAALTKLAVAQSALQTELEGGLDALAARLQRLEDANSRVAAKQRALASALTEDAAGEAPPPPLVRPLTLTKTCVRTN